MNNRKHPLYRTWCDMRSRCLNPRHKYFHHYGGRGITISDEWESFDVFYEDMLSGWKRGLTLDRKDNNGPYSKSNCRWGTRKQQANNTRRNIKLEFQGQEKTLTQWAEERGINESTLYGRIQSGWPIDRALTIIPNGTRLTYGNNARAWR